MTNAFAAAAADLAADPNMGQAADFFLGVGDGNLRVAVSVVMSQPVEDALPGAPGGRGLQRVAAIAHLAVSALPEGAAPGRGDVLRLSADTAYAVETARLDETGTSWRLDLRKAS